MHQRRMNRPSTCLLGSGSVLGWLQVGVPQVEALENPSQVQDETPGRPEYDRALVRRGDLTINRGPNRSGANATPCCARLTCAGQDMIEAWIDEGVFRRWCMNRYPTGSVFFGSCVARPGAVGARAAESDADDGVGYAWWPRTRTSRCRCEGGFRGLWPRRRGTAATLGGGLA